MTRAVLNECARVPAQAKAVRPFGPAVKRFTSRLIARGHLLPLLLAGVTFGLAGCQPAVKPDPGMAALRVKVVAELKFGAPIEESNGSGYDSGPAARPNAAWETLDYSDLPDIVVWLEPVAGSAAPSGALIPDQSIDVSPERPKAGRVVAVSVGQRVVFHNTGSKAGEVYSVCDGNDFSIASVPPDGTGSYTVRSPGPIEVLSDPAREPLAELYAAPSRWVLPARSGEKLIFNNIPPGQYRLVSWHPRLPGTETAVTLSADAVSDATIKVGVNDLPKVNAK